MSHIEEFEKRAEDDSAPQTLYLFGWVDKAGNGGDYGLNQPPALKTFQMLISTTYMFQPEPQFTLRCRPFTMTQAQFDYLQDHDLDTESFLSQLGPLPDVSFELDLSLYKDAQSAINALGGLSF